MAIRFGRLSVEELVILEDSFVQFLVVQGIDAPSWIKIKEEKPEQMNLLLDQFSDYVYYSTLTSCQFISKTDNQVFITSQLSKNKISTFKLILSDNDLSKIDSEEVFFSLLENKELNIRDLTFESSIIKGDRAEFIFDLIKKGHFKIDKGRLYKTLALLQAEN